MRSNLFLRFLLLGWGYLTQQICEAKSPQEASTQACMSNYVLSIAPKDIAFVGNLYFQQRLYWNFCQERPLVLP